MKLSLVLLGAFAVACGPSYTADDTTANGIAARHEAANLANCATDDAGTCNAAAVRAHSTIAYCANARELSAHGQPIPDAGVACQPR